MTAAVDPDVFIEGRFLTQPLSGVQRYAREITRALDALAGEGRLRQRYTLLLPPTAERLGLTHIEERVVGRGGGHRWTQTGFARASSRGIALSLAASGPLFHNRQIVVIHDAAVFRHPEFYSRPYVLAHRAIDRVLARTAQLATVSAFSRRELSDVLGVPEARILVAPNGAEHLRLVPDDTIVGRLALEGRPFFLVLGSLTANKNLAVAMRALERIAATGAKLVVVGGLDGAVFNASMPDVGDNVILAGRLSDSEIAGLMRSARALIFPSIYEGFGIPPLEAMMNQCPVLASTAEAVVEVCGAAADYFAPHDDATLAELMNRVLADDGGWRAEKLAKGQERLARYSWRASAEILADACATLAWERRQAA